MKRRTRRGRNAVTPVAPADARARTADDDSQGEPRRTRRRNRVRWTLFALLPVALIAGGYAYVTGGQVMSTDDAYVEADKVGISTDVSGIVQDVAVKDNQHVTAGQVLYRLDPRQFQIALDNAKANLAQIALSIEAMKQDYKRMLSDAAAQQAQVDLDQINYDRNAMLLRSRHGVAGRVRSGALHAATTTRASLRPCASRRRCSSPGSAAMPDIGSTQHPQYRQAKAQLDEAQRELDHTVVTAPFAGIVTDVPSIAPGKYLAASTTAFYLVDTDHVWVDANPKETELTYVRPGQPVTVTVDTYPDATGTASSRASARRRRRNSRCCRRRTPAATGSRSCSACRCASASTLATRASRRCAPA